MFHKKKHKPNTPHLVVEKPAEAPTIDTKHLSAIYGGILATSVADRFSALNEAIKWYEAAEPALLKLVPMDAAKTKLYSWAKKARNLGLNETTVEAQETGLLTCIHKYEQIWPSMPKVDPFYDELKATRADIEAKESAEALEFENTLLPALNTAYQPLNVVFKLDRAAEKQRAIDAGSVVLSLPLARSLFRKNKEEGLLPVLFSEGHAALYAASVTDNTVSAPKVAQQVPVMLSAILKHCESVQPRSSLFKGFTDLTATASPKASKPSAGPKVYKAHTGGAGKGKVAGLWVPGKTAAVVFLNLVDEQPHDITQWGIKNVHAWVRGCIKAGNQTGKFSISLSGNTAKMTVIDQSVKP